MSKNLSEIFRSLEDALVSSGKREYYDAMWEAGKAGATGTECLLLAIDHLSELLGTDPDAINAAGGPIDDLIEFCHTDGLVLTGPLVEARRRAQR